MNPYKLSRPACSRCVRPRANLRTISVSKRPFNYPRGFQTTSSVTPDIAFAFDIDGVLLRSSKPIPGAADALRTLQDRGIPFILLTNGGGKHETERVAEISQKLQIPLDPSVIIQSHSPFAELVHGAFEQEALGDKCILVAGGDSDSCRQVALRYGFKSVVTPGDIFHAHPSIWPFSKPFKDYYKTFARPLPKPIDPNDPANSLKIDAMFVFNDPRDWGLDAQVIVDVLLSEQGILGTLSKKNGNPDLPNRGYQQDGQPPLYFSNPDLWWAAAYHLPRLGQGGFREALEGTWAAITGGPSQGVELVKTVVGKPYRLTYRFAENQLLRNRAKMLKSENLPPIKKVFMVGDNPESDIRGANSYKSEHGSDWHSILVRTGVYNGGEPSTTPRTIVDDVKHAVDWALKTSL